jgi:hypothetical protein
MPNWIVWCKRWLERQDIRAGILTSRTVGGG